MSRLYLILQENLKRNPLDPSLIRRILQESLSSHGDLSHKAFLEISFPLAVERRALVSEYVGFRTYPVSYQASLSRTHFSLVQKVQIDYSSTCPCSAALSRQVIKETFQKQFQGRDTLSIDEIAGWLEQEEALAATPHGQRSEAHIEILLADPLQGVPFLKLIDRLEQALGTPVQSAVKRPDEQEFARLNAKNLMFAEDAARRLAAVLSVDEKLVDFRVKVSHIESLHPHDAVAIVSKQKSPGSKLGWR